MMKDNPTNIAESEITITDDNEPDQEAEPLPVRADSGFQKAEQADSSCTGRDTKTYPKPCPDCPGDGTGMCCKTTNKAGDNYATQSIQEDAFNAGVEAEWARLEGMAMVADILIGKDGVMSAQVAKIQEMYR